ncbi:uncharacterized protein ACOB8E_013143 isoform 1-T1 [Sarcophilus harrisii]
MCLESREWIRGPRILVYTAAALGRAATCRAAAPFRRRGPGPGRPKRPRLAFGSTLWSPRSGLKDPSPYIAGERSCMFFPLHFIAAAVHITGEIPGKTAPYPLFSSLRITGVTTPAFPLELHYSGRACYTPFPYTA